MAQLNISLLGTFQVMLGGRPQSAFETDKTRALLAFLAVESNRPHRREALATMLWPNYSDRAARNSLRQTLFRLRQAIADQKKSDPHLLVSVHDVQFNPASEHWLDVDEFIRLLDTCQSHHPKLDTLCESCQNRLESTVALYQGNFLAGFSLSDSPDFETWQLLQQESCHRRILDALGWLGNYYEQKGEYGLEAALAKREIELAPWRESAHRRAMRALALSGRRQAALRQFDICREILNLEIGVEPVSETLKLFEAIRDGKIEDKVKAINDQGEITIRQQSNVNVLKKHHQPFSSFVNFPAEFAKLNSHLDDSLAGQGKVVFVVGEGGRGKTTLIGKFIENAIQTHSNLLAAAGQCDAQFGLGIPFQPFCEILRIFGEGGFNGARVLPFVTSKVPAEDYHHRLSTAIPDFIQALVNFGPDLVGIMLSEAALISRVQDSNYLNTDSKIQLQELLSKRVSKLDKAKNGQGVSINLKSPTLVQGILIDQVTRVLQSLAKRHPMILFLDDLQWADVATVSLLLHLGRQLASNRILIIGAYRPETIAPTKVGEMYHLESVIHELQRKFGNFQIDMDQMDGMDFINALVDGEPNKLNLNFRTAIYKQTAGNPLFTVELLRNLEKQDHLKRDPTGCWIIDGSLDWTPLPPRIEGLLVERFSRLPTHCQAILSAASVQGRSFIAEVVAQVLNYDPDEIIHILGDGGVKGHNLIKVKHIEYVNGRRLSHYEFLHTLFQQYLYQELDDVKRHLLHKATGMVLQSVYSDSTNDQSMEIVGHFQAAGFIEKATGNPLPAGKIVHLQ
jgi:DNA-binding SARP family transcriptional activator